jgi:peptidoglycan/LPS O-acetylase OafA/YrhL
VPKQNFFYSYNSVSWSISTEFAFYLLFPILLHRLRQTWHVKLLCVSALSVLLIAFCVVAQLPEQSPSATTSFGVLQINPLARLFEFFVGMCTALLWKTTRSSLRLGKLAWTLIELAALAAFFLFIRWVLLVYPHMLPYRPATQWLAMCGFAPASALLLYVFATGNGIVARILAWKPLVFLGEISFAIYMLHQVLILAYWQNKDAFAFIPVEFRYPLFLASLLALCSIVYLWVERPARQAIVAAADRRLQRAASPEVSPPPAGIAGAVR